MIQTLRKYYRIWLMTAQNALQQAFVNRWTNLLFMLGKAIRFLIAIAFILLLRSNISEIGGYNSEMLLVFMLTYHFLETVAQVFYRGVYEFGKMIRTGTFDGLLTKPVNTLFSVMTGHPDLNDAVFLVVSTSISGYLLATSELEFSLTSIIMYTLLCGISFLILTSIHILIACLTLLTTDVDNLMFMYRDISKLGQFPVTIYPELIKTALFFLVPVGFMVTIPSQVLLSIAPSYGVATSIIFGLSFFWLSLQIWKVTVKKYSSASS